MTTHLLIAVLAEVPVCLLATLWVVHRMLRVHTETTATVVGKRADGLDATITLATARIEEHVTGRTDHLADTVSELADATRAVLGAQVRQAEAKPAAAVKTPAAKTAVAKPATTKTTAKTGSRAK